MAKQTFTTGQVLTAAQMTSLQQTAMGGGSATAKTASYTLVAADAGATVIMNSASATTITVNTSLFSAGDTVFIQNIGAGVSTITAGTATVNTASSLALAQYDSGTLYFTAAGASIFSKAAGTAAGASGPAFSAYKSSDQTFSANTFTKITFDSETFDTGAAFASSTFTPQTAGYYQINYTIFLDPQGTNETIRGQLYKNGSTYLENFRIITNYGGFSSGMVVYMNGTTDYLEVYAICGNSPACKGGSTLSSFNGVWIRS